jgi:endonuclease/exonuclease/phosphatase family metal-dependent hydrolase
MRANAESSPDPVLPLTSIVGRFFIAVVVVFLAGVMVAWLAAYIRPTTLWPLEFLAVPVPFLLPVVAAVAVLVAFTGPRWLLVLSVAVLVLVTVRVVPLERVFYGATPQDDDLLMITYNMPEAYGPAMPEKTEQVIAFFRDLDPDLVVLQEAFMEFHPGSAGQRGRPYVRVMWDSLGFSAANHSPGRSTYTPQPVFGKMPLTGQTQVNIEVGEPHIDRTYVVRTTFEWQGREAVIYNLHLRSYGRNKPWQEGRRQIISPRLWRQYWRQYRTNIRDRAKEVVEIRAMIDQETLPVLVAGDFNSTPNMWVYRHLSRGMQDAFRVAGRGWGKTYHSNRALVRIDYILASREWVVTEAYTLDPGLSDHRPVVARLRWRE